MPAPIRSLRRPVRLVSPVQDRPARPPRARNPADGDFGFEPLESRQLLSVAPLHAVGMNTVHAREDFQNKVVDLSHAFTDADYSTRALDLRGDREQQSVAVRVAARPSVRCNGSCSTARRTPTARPSFRCAQPIPWGRTADVSFAVDIAPVNDPAGHRFAGRWARCGYRRGPCSTSWPPE